MTMTISNNSSAKRITVQIPTSSDDPIEAWFFLPEGGGRHPAVVMAHGIGGIKAGGLAPFAERFREEGFAAIAFDYRNFGGSGGQPREVLSVPRQRADYSTVIGWAVEQPYIDPRQIIAWGTSFAGMHVLELAVSDNRLAAAIAQAPLTDGLAAAMMSKPKNGARLFGLAMLDRVGSLFGRQPIYIPGHGRPGDLSIGATPDGPFGEKLMTPQDGTPWHDRVAARSLLSFSWRRPVRRAASVRVFCLLVVPEADSIAPVPAALEVARKAPGAELFRSVGGHYDVYEGGASFADVLRTEVDFLHRHVKTAAQKLS
jgi:pimeloyl-ACP methyl ester carboxylesterase